MEESASSKPKVIVFEAKKTKRKRQKKEKPVFEVVKGLHTIPLK